MKLSRYIKDHSEQILAAWDSFARTLEPAASHMTSKALRDHARQILNAIALDIDTAQSADEAFAKSQGDGPQAFFRSAASTHGTLREVSGFTLVQLTAEFRALRASVLRLWLSTIETFDKHVTDDIVRFNEAVDQALAESAVTFSENTNRTRDTFLAILGHDLRTPLSAISMAGLVLERSPPDGERIAATGRRLRRSAATMSSMVNDLLEYARSQLGGGMPMTPTPADMRDICEAALDDARAAYPDCVIESTLGGDLKGEFDKVRLQQVMTNLLTNAAQYRASDSPVILQASGDEGHVSVQVINFGVVIPAESLATLFTALVQLPLDAAQAARQSTSLGLGLFIAREIVQTHGGTISVASDAPSGTTFTVRIPRMR